MNKILLSFGIPVYNAEKYICELLNCFDFNSSFSYEIIIVDDGSTDNSAELIRKMNVSNINLISQLNGGVSSARNKIIEMARGKWLTFVDADDLIDFNKYVELFNNNINDSYDYYIGIRKNKFYNYKSNQLEYLIENELINSPWDKFFRVDILKNYNIRFNQNLSLSEDLLFNLEYYNIVNNFNTYFSNHMYISRNVNSNSLTHKYRDNKYDELMIANSECRKIYSHDKKILKSLEYIRIKYSISCIKDFFYFEDKFDKSILSNSVDSMKKRYNREFVMLNNLKASTLYNLWYLLSPKSLIFIIKIYSKHH